MQFSALGAQTYYQTASMSKEAHAKTATFCNLLSCRVPLCGDCILPHHRRPGIFCRCCCVAADGSGGDSVQTEGGKGSAGAQGVPSHHIHGYKEGVSFRNDIRTLSGPRSIWQPEVRFVSCAFCENPYIACCDGYDNDGDCRAYLCSDCIVRHPRVPGIYCRCCVVATAKVNLGQDMRTYTSGA